MIEHPRVQRRWRWDWDTVELRAGVPQLSATALQPASPYPEDYTGCWHPYRALVDLGGRGEARCMECRSVLSPSEVAVSRAAWKALDVPH